MSIIGTIYEDVTTDVLGRMGSWQWLITFISTCLLVPSMFNQYEDTFLLYPSTSISCSIPDHYNVLNSTLCTFTLSGNSTEELKCTKWHIKLLWFIWIKKSWTILCEHEMKLLATTIVCRIGLLFGYVIFGLISDCFGRRKAIMISLTAELGFRLVIVFCDSDNWFRLLIFLKSLFGSAIFYMTLVLICEIASNTWRSQLLAIVSMPRILATACLVSLANSGLNLETLDFIIFAFEASLLLLLSAPVLARLCIQDSLNLASISTNIIIVGFTMLIFYVNVSYSLNTLLFHFLTWTPESPQWLLYNRKILQAEELLFKAAKANRIELCSNFKIRPVNYRAYNCLDKVWTCVEILSTYNIRFVVTASLLYWNLFYFLWSCLYLRVYTAKHQFLLFKVFGLIIFFGSLTIFLSVKLRLKQLLLISILLMGTSNAVAIIMNFLEYSDSIQSMIVSLAVTSGLIGHALILNITPRLFAINVRATLLGCCNAVGQLGTIISYLIIVFRVADDRTLLFVEVALTFVLSAACYVIPDIDGRELPDVIEDMDYFSELSKPLRWATQKTNSPSKEEIQIKVYSFGSAGQNLSTRSHSEERLPARPIGFRNFFNYLQLYIDKFKQK